MPTKILVIETPSFQLGANAGEKSEKLAPEAFPARLKKHAEEGGKDTLFVLAPSELRLHPAFSEAVAGPAAASLAFFPGPAEAVRFLPCLPAFAADERATGIKECLARGSAIYTEAIFHAKAVGSRLDPCFSFARAHLSAGQALNAWGCLESLAFLGLQSLPELGERGSGEKIDVQIGADERFLALTVRFDATPPQALLARSSPLLTLPRFAAGVMETRYIQNAAKLELSCLFFRSLGPEKTVEIASFHVDSTLETRESAGAYVFKSFGELAEAAPPEQRKGAGGGFRKKFSDQVRLADPPQEPAKAEGGGGGAAAAPAAPAPAAPQPDAASAARIKELEGKVRGLEAAVKARDEALSKASKEQFDPSKKRDVIHNIIDSQSEVRKQTLNALELELEEAKKREKELLALADKAVKMKDEAVKKIKDLDTKLKQASGGQSSKVTMLERQLEEQKRQNKELSARVGELNKKLQAA